MRPAWARCAAAWLAFAVAGMLTLPAAAETTAIPISDSAIWKQDQARFEMPPAIDGFRREGLVDYGDQRLDVSGTYQDGTNGTSATLYLFRPPVPDVAMWHDRSLASIQPRSELGSPDRGAAVTTPFAPPGTGGAATGLRTVMPASGAAITSTGLAMFQLRDWLVAVRMSSRTLDPSQLAARMDSFVAALSYDHAGMSQEPVRVMADCPDALRFKSPKRANPPNLGATLLLSALSGIAEDEAGDAKEASVPAPQAAFCRDAASTEAFGVYRAGGSTEGYVIALADAGVSVNVARQPATALLGGGGGANDYWIELATPYASSTYRGFRNLPPPDKVVEVINSERPLSSVSRTGPHDTTINLDSSVLK